MRASSALYSVALSTGVNAKEIWFRPVPMRSVMGIIV